MKSQSTDFHGFRVLIRCEVKSLFATVAKGFDHPEINFRLMQRAGCW